MASKYCLSGYFHWRSLIINLSIILFKMEELVAVKDEFEKTCIAGGHPNHFHLLPEMGDLVLEKETKI